MTFHPLKKGFTLVELLVVISIISLLSSVVYANLAFARTKAVDTRKKADISSVRTAIASYNLDAQHPPHMYDCSGSTCVVNDSRATAEIEDRDNPMSESSRAFRASMQELVDSRTLSKIPESPGGAGYFYYTYGSGSMAGAMIGSTMQGDKQTTTGQSGTCRPFPGSQQSRAESTSTFARNSAVPTAHAQLQQPVEGPPGFQREICIYVNEQGQIYENQCPLEAGPNLCTQDDSQDYCLCTQY